ncbi:hypothetical protein BFP70_02845 [Thioclava sp. SK-1]|uniref:alpha/beta hydrolase family protein n=1 Tax=Thioclava sp. SK-1 TaxID=1889770 RepID=UPI00082571A1|nr:alpha/beta hydrolase [Thioclava sp. SK-1]OCX67117.1 hypothetical protein BFP70_02845 [Thioclava sp. SK-1]
MADTTAPPCFKDVTAKAKRDGGFCLEMAHHALAYLPGNGAAGKNLVVTFGNLATYRAGGPQWPWAYKLLAEQGWSVLGVINQRGDWWRDRALLTALTRLRNAGFYDRFLRVSTYGASMGGYGALAFGAVIPNAHAVCFAPQSSLDPCDVPFETRYTRGFEKGDWSLPFSDAASALPHLRRATIFYDPFQQLDKAHINRLRGPNVTLYPLRHIGHVMPPILKRMGVLKSVAIRALSETLTRQELAQMMRARRNLGRYHEMMLHNALARGHFDLGINAIDHTRRELFDHWRVKGMRRKLREGRMDAKQRKKRSEG